MNNSKFRAILLKCVPYLLSIAGGLTIFLVSSREIHDANLNDLINNISASLLSIPLVFLLYDYSNYLISRRVNKTLVAGMVGRVNSIMATIQATLHHIAGVKINLSWNEFERMLASRRISFKEPNITKPDIKQLTTCRDQLDDIVYRIAQTRALAHTQIQTLNDIAREISHILDQYKYHGVNGAYIRHLNKILALMGDWYDYASQLATPDNIPGPEIG